MKKILLSLILLPFALNCLGTEELSKLIVQEPTVKQELLPAVAKPKIAVISLIADFDNVQVMMNLIKTAKDKEIAGILLLIDCNGGSAAKFSVLHDLIKKIRLKKPVVGLIIGSAFSGGYFVASATDYLIAHTATELGSIGTICEVRKFSDSKITTGNTKSKFDVELFYAGEYKALFNPYKKLTDDDRKQIKNELERSYQLFLKVVAENRGLDLSNYKEWAEGKSHIASDALKMGLIDEIGTIFEAEKKLLELLRKRNPDILYDSEMEYIFDSPKEKTKLSKQ